MITLKCATDEQHNRGLLQICQDVVRVDHLSATMPGGFRHDLNLLVESLQVKTTEDAYGVMLRAAEQIHHRVCGHAQP